MINFLSSIIQTGLFQIIQWILFSLLIVVITETVFCTAWALQFRVEELAGYSSRFALFYDISAQRDAVTWIESKHNWLLWLSVCTGNTNRRYVHLSSLQGKAQFLTTEEFLRGNLQIVKKNIMRALKNIGRFTLMIFLVPFYFVFFVGSSVERVYRLLLKPIVYLGFWVLAISKIKYIYYFKGNKLVVDSRNIDAFCTSDVLYRKPVIQILLHGSQACDDSFQKDNLNRFTAMLKERISDSRYIKFKTEIVYSEEAEVVQKELPLTFSYLKANYTNLIYIKNKEVLL